MFMKKHLLISFLLVVSTSFISFAQSNPQGPGDNSEGVPVQVIRHGPTTHIIPHNIVFFSSYLAGEVSLFGNAVEIVFSQPISVSSVTLTNLNDGRTSCTYFNDVITDHVVVPSLSYNGLWDICVTSGNTVYHAGIYVDCYQSLHTCPEN